MGVLVFYYRGRLAYRSIGMWLEVESVSFMTSGSAKTQILEGTQVWSYLAVWKNTRILQAIWCYNRILASSHHKYYVFPAFVGEQVDGLWMGFFLEIYMGRTSEGVIDIH